MSSTESEEEFAHAPVRPPFEARDAWLQFIQQTHTGEGFVDGNADTDTDTDTKSATEVAILRPIRTSSTRLIMIDSLDRDQNVYPSPTEIRLKLPRTYRNIERIDIVQIKFFCGLYSISETLRNNMMDFADASGSYTLTIPSGSYSPTELCGVLEGLMNAVSVLPSHTYSVSQNTNTGRITFAGLAPFSLSLFRVPLPAYLAGTYSDWGLGWTLGWCGKPTVLSGAASYTAQTSPRIHGPDYIFLQMNDTEHMNTVDHTGLEVVGASQTSTGQVSHYFGKLLMNSFGCWAQTFLEAPKIYTTPLGKLERLQFTWTDRQGNPLTGSDALACDWHATIRITESTASSASTPDL